MTLRCIIFGHLRSRSRATYDDKNKRWISPCKRCRILLVREGPGQWRPLPPPPRDRNPSEPSPTAKKQQPILGPAVGRANEAPVIPTGGRDAAERPPAAIVEDLKEPV